jgi:hypothetical protein
MTKIITGVGIGGVLGYIYYKIVGCSTGTCPITSKPINSIIYGAVMGFLFTV